MSKIKKAQRDEQMEQSGVRLHLGEKGERGVAEAQKRKGTVIDYEKRVSHAEMMRFTAKNKDLIDKWANEYNTNENFRKSVDAKIMNHEGLSTKEYFSFLLSTNLFASTWKSFLVAFNTINNINISIAPIIIY